VKYHGLFHGDEAQKVSAADYRRWLLQQDVRFVAVPDVPLDPSARAAARVIAQRPSYLHPVWRNRNWQVFEVRAGGAPSGDAATIERLGPQTFAARVRRPGVSLLRVRWTPYWELVRGSACLAPSPDGWTVLHAKRPGIVSARARFDVSRALSRGPRCSAARPPDD
jgi:hypothetical protein